MRLFIAEKHSLARSIAAVLPKPQENNKLYIKAGDDIGGSSPRTGHARTVR